LAGAQAGKQDFIT